MSTHKHTHTHACRCLHTATEVLKGINVNATNVEEFVRETLGEDTCDARRSVSDPSIPTTAVVDTTEGGGSDDSGSSNNRPPRPGPPGPCSFDKGLATLFPQYKYRVSVAIRERGREGGGEESATVCVKKRLSR